MAATTNDLLDIGHIGQGIGGLIRNRQGAVGVDCEGQVVGHPREVQRIHALVRKFSHDVSAPVILEHKDIITGMADQGITLARIAGQGVVVLVPFDGCQQIRASQG